MEALHQLVPHTKGSKVHWSLMRIIKGLPKAAKKVRNLRSKPNVYFSVDDENFPYKGVKGKGTAAIIEDPKRTVPLGEKINMKYLGTLDHPIPMMILDSTKKGNHVVVEISPKFFSTWDSAKIQ